MSVEALLESQKRKLFSNLASLCNSRTHSDLTIHCQSSTFHAHHNTLSLQTPFFATAAASFSEGATNSITLDSHAPGNVLRFLRWCYTGDYPEIFEPKVAGAEYTGAMTHIEVYLLADYLGAEGLQEVAARKFRHCYTESFWVDGEMFRRSLRLVFENTVKRKDMLREQVIAIGEERHEELKSLDGYEELLYEFPEYAVGLAWRLRSQ